MASYPSSRSFTVPVALRRLRVQRGLVWGAMIIGALFAFELFNFSTTEFALSDLLGELDFFGLKWSTILAIAFCGIDFAGIARLFTPEAGADEPAEIWYLFGAWLLAATMNAMLTWWGVSIAILKHETLGNAIVERQLLLDAVPIFVALMVWLSRVLIIGTFSVAGERLFTQADKRQGRQSSRRQDQPSYLDNQPSARSPFVAPAFRPSPKPKPVARPDSILNNDQTTYSRPEPTYHPVGAKPPRSNGGTPGYR